jgi:hypothetical protein
MPDEAVLDLADPAGLVVREPEVPDDLDVLGHPLPWLHADDLAADDPLADVDFVLGGTLPPVWPGVADVNAGIEANRPPELFLPLMRSSPSFPAVSVRMGGPPRDRSQSRCR